MLIFKCFPIQVGNFISYGVCKLAYKPPLKRVTPHGVGRCPQGRGDRSVRGGPAKLVEGFFSLYSSQPISQGVTLLFFFTEKKKEAKKEKSSHSTCIIRFKYHPKFPPTKIPRRGIQAACYPWASLPSPLPLGDGLAAAAVTLPFLQLKLGRKVSGDSPLDRKRAPSVAESAL